MVKSKSEMGYLKLLVVISLISYANCEYSASTLVRNIYEECLSQFSVECVKPRALEWISMVSNDDEIKVTEDLSIVRTAIIEDEEPRSQQSGLEIVDAVDKFIQSHSVRVKVPAEVTNSAASEYVPRSLLEDLPTELDMPLDGEEDQVEGRKKRIKIKLPKPLRIKSKHGFIKKILLPFLLGLKFKASVLVPLALALIALKTWKALTLGLISLVLSGAMVIFKFTKPKVVNYEVIHYPQHHVEHHVDHHAPGWDSHGPYQQRSYEEANDIAYAAQNM